MRIESSVTSLSWIPSEAISGVMRLPFDLGPVHYDDPPADRIADIPAIARSGAVRFINELRAWLEVENGSIVRQGQSGHGWMGRTKLGFGARKLLFPTIPMPDIRPEPEVSGSSVRFVQTTGGRVAMPMPRKLNRPPFVQIIPPVVWTTMALTINADGSSSFEVLGASPFPRHWIYDGSGTLSHKVATTDFSSWSGDIFGARTPWGKEDSPAFVTEVETELERELSQQIMRGGAKPEFRKLAKDQALVEQGDSGDQLFLLLDGVLSVEVDGKAVAEVGPGAILGERASLEGGTRTATLRALTPVRVAVAAPDQLSPEALAEVAGGHRREESQ
ncbi:MAG TPA: cyclic nucleotide-binding domain-containing protein [Candidatus Dormibacteraeota bacterium]|nr:cyclic nucleotide-binding domain-containing protein [Candidatus Dormibacteraeota bacterium]